MTCIVEILLVARAFKILFDLNYYEEIVRSSTYVMVWNRFLIYIIYYGESQYKRHWEALFNDITVDCSKKQSSVDQKFESIRITRVPWLWSSEGHIPSAPLKFMTRIIITAFSSQQTWLSWSINLVDGVLFSSILSPFYKYSLLMSCESILKFWRVTRFNASDSTRTTLTVLIYIGHDSLQSPWPRSLHATLSLSNVPLPRK